MLNNGFFYNSIVRGIREVYLDKNYISLSFKDFILLIQKISTISLFRSLENRNIDKSDLGIIYCILDFYKRNYKENVKIDFDNNLIIIGN